MVRRTSPQACQEDNKPSSHWWRRNAINWNVYGLWEFFWTQEKWDKDDKPIFGERGELRKQFWLFQLSHFHLNSTVMMEHFWFEYVSGLSKIRTIRLLSSNWKNERRRNVTRRFRFASFRQSSQKEKQCLFRGPICRTSWMSRLGWTTLTTWLTVNKTDYVIQAHTGTRRPPRPGETLNFVKPPFDEPMTHDESTRIKR